LIKSGQVANRAISPDEKLGEGDGQRGGMQYATFYDLPWWQMVE